MDSPHCSATTLHKHTVCNPGRSLVHNITAPQLESEKGQCTYTTQNINESHLVWDLSHLALGLPGLQQQSDRETHATAKDG
jgi:hypothetical protein